jgi:hypothetical protein
MPEHNCHAVKATFLVMGVVLLVVLVADGGTVVTLMS